MTAIHGKATSVLLGGYDLTPWLNSINPTDTTDVVETSVFQQDDKTYVPGMADAKVTWAGRFAGEVGAIRDIIRTQILTAAVYALTVSFGKGIKAGYPALFGDTDDASFGVTATTADVVSVSGDAQVTGGWHDGIHLLDAAVLNGTTTGPTENFPLGGLPWALAVHAIGSTATDIVTVQAQHTADPLGSWADLGAPVTFAAGESGSRVLTGTDIVNQYVRAVVTFAGGGAVKVLAAFGRV